MKRLGIAMLLIAACRRPLAPGETRCTSEPNFLGQVETECKSGPQMPVAGAPVAATPGQGWWCSYRSDGYSQCLRVPGQCENWRSQGNARRDGLDYFECGFLSVAFCAQSGCTATIAGCATAEKLYGRDGMACVAVQ